MAVSGAVMVLPWVTIPERVLLQGFEFVPLSVSQIEGFVTEVRTASCITSMLQDYVNLLKEPIISCTFVAMLKSDTPWYICDAEFANAKAATRTLALAAMAEQRFFEAPCSDLFHRICPWS